MEHGTRAAAATGSPVSQAKLTQTFRVSKRDSVKQEQLPKQELGTVNKEKQERPVKKEKHVKQELLNPEHVKIKKLVKQEPVKKPKPVVSHDSQHGSQESDPEGPSGSLLCRASNMLTQTKQSERPGHQNKAPGLSGVTMVTSQRVKKELLSPSSCLTNDSSIFLREKEAEVVASNTTQKSVTDAQSLATAHANLMCSKNARAQAPDAATASGGPSLPLVPAESLQKLPEEVSVKSLMTALVMIQESSTIIDATLNVSLVKRELVEPAQEKLLTALDMLKGGGGAHGHVSSSPITSSGAVSESQQTVAEAPPMKLMTALHMLPSRDGLRHVKSEPADASGPSPELENFQRRISVKEEVILSSHLLENLPNGRDESQAAAAPAHVAPEEPEEDCSQFPKTCAQDFGAGVKDPEDLSQDFNSGAETQLFPTRNSQDFRINLPEETLISQLQKLRNGMASPSTHESTSFSDSGTTSSQDSDDAEDSIRWRPSKVFQKSQKETKSRNTNPGRRIQGGRLYDSAFGKTCHWCRQKTVEPHVKCRECTIYYCGPCLMNRNGENIRDELCDGVEWLCPKCRNGCGPGCENCCNCGPCRKALGKLPTGQMVSVARSAGFKNAHDYLVHLETGETPRRIAQRKVGKGWTNCGRFLSEPVSESGDEDGEEEDADGEEEFTLNEETSTQLHQGKLDMKFLRRFVQSQKRKRVSMRPPLPAKKTPRPTADSLLASVVAQKQRLAEKREAIAKILESRGNKTSQDEGSAFRRNQISIGVNPVAVKREFEECSLTSESGLKRLKVEGLCDASLPSSFAGVKCKIEPNTSSEDSEVPSKTRGASSLNGGGGTNASMECPSDPQGLDYRMKLKSVLAQPFSAEELESLDSLIRSRKPMQKLRQMRGRVVDVVTEDEGLSYLDHHQDFVVKFEEADSDPEKLALLRGFFFWLQHSCMEGAFRPWPSSQAQARRRSGDCIETEGPDCQVTAVVLQLDETSPHVKRKFTQRPPETPGEIHGSHNTSRQSLIPFQAKKTLVQPAVKPKMRAQLAVAPAVNFRVVLGLPAPALSKVEDSFGEEVDRFKVAQRHQSSNLLFENDFREESSFSKATAVPQVFSQPLAGKGM